MKKILVIAEAGVNHNGSLDTAKRLVEVAANAGADFVKFQTFSAEDIVLKTAEKAEYQKSATDSAESQYEMLKRLELTSEMHEHLIEHCKKFSIGFLSTGFDQASIRRNYEFTVSGVCWLSGSSSDSVYGNVNFRRSW